MTYSCNNWDDFALFGEIMACFPIIVKSLPKLGLLSLLTIIMVHQSAEKLTDHMDHKTLSVLFSIL